ncbi:unnamed protein product [Blepharisma stoltei]|uniref:ribose-phosphate diphosphokinase n=1 Tax=Blepharisma stoltei TaxID=1481888 RepID=A0AAU9KJW8_9CILI|nr:unnamed protein product [Blepharisma stoltei]
MWARVLAGGFLLAQMPSLSDYYIPPSSQVPVKIISGSGSKELAHEVSGYLGIQLARVGLSNFADGESSIKIIDNVAGRDVFVIQSLCQPIQDNLMELILMLETLKSSNCRKVIAIVPYMAYARQDIPEKVKPGIPSAEISMLLEAVGLDAVVCVDYHGEQAKGFFNVPVTEIKPYSVAVEYLKSKNLKKPVIISPDIRGFKRAYAFYEIMNEEGIDCDIALMNHGGTSMSYINKHRRNEYVGDVLTGRDIVIVDDMIITGSRLMNALENLRKRDAERIFMYATHGNFTNEAIKKIEKSSLTELIITNTIPLKQNSYKIVSLSLGKVIADVILEVVTHSELN